MKSKLTIVLIFITAVLDAQVIMNIHQSNGTIIQIPSNTIDSTTYTITSPGTLAIVNTLLVGNITSTGAVSGGNVISNGGTPVTHYGVCFSTSPNPTTANEKTVDGSGSGIFTSYLNNLVANTTYFIRAYATNSSGTSYGNELVFTTTANNGIITNLYCSSAIDNGQLISGIMATGVNSIIPYTGGNGGIYIGQTVSSTGVTGLTAVLQAGGFNIDSGQLVFTITGTPSGTGTANFQISIGGQTCILSRSVGSAFVSIPGPGITYNGYTYSTVILGNGQEWMAENLRTSFYANGDSVLNVIDIGAWSSLTTGAWVHYQNNLQFENPYGKLYNWYAASDSRNVCPNGWHVPSSSEWSHLINFLDPSSNGGLSSNYAGSKMKLTGIVFWTCPNLYSTNESGFSAIGSGLASSSSPYFVQMQEIAVWWARDQVNSIIGFSAKVGNTGLPGSFLTSAYLQDGNLKTRFFSIRCLKD